jgi:hypothetical protein
MTDLSAHYTSKYPGVNRQIFFVLYPLLAVDTRECLDVLRRRVEGFDNAPSAAYNGRHKCRQPAQPA